MANLNARSMVLGTTRHCYILKYIRCGPHGFRRFFKSFSHLNLLKTDLVSAYKKRPRSNFLSFLFPWSAKNINFGKVKANILTRHIIKK